MNNDTKKLMEAYEQQLDELNVNPLTRAGRAGISSLGTGAKTVASNIGKGMTSGVKNMFTGGTTQYADPKEAMRTSQIKNITNKFTNDMNTIVGKDWTKRYPDLARQIQGLSSGTMTANAPKPPTLPKGTNSPVGPTPTTQVQSPAPAQTPAQTPVVTAPTQAPTQAQAPVPAQPQTPVAQPQVPAQPQAPVAQPQAQTQKFSSGKLSQLGRNLAKSGVSPEDQKIIKQAVQSGATTAEDIHGLLKAKHGQYVTKNSKEAQNAIMSGLLATGKDQNTAQQEINALPENRKFDQFLSKLSLIK